MTNSRRHGETSAAEWGTCGVVDCIYVRRRLGCLAWLITEATGTMHVWWWIVHLFVVERAVVILDRSFGSPLVVYSHHPRHRRLHMLRL